MPLDASTSLLLEHRAMLVRGEVPCHDPVSAARSGYRTCTWAIALGEVDARSSRSLSSQESEADRAKEIGTQLDGARDRASVAEIERNRLALAKAVKAALWVTEARLNLAVPELLEMAQLWVGKSTAAWRKMDAAQGSGRHRRPRRSVSPLGFLELDGHHWRSTPTGALPLSPRRSKGM